MFNRRGLSALLLALTGLQLQVSNANQIDGCYTLASGSEIQLRNPASSGGGLALTVPLSGALIATADGSYALDVKDSYTPNTFIRRLSFDSLKDDRANKQITADANIAVMLHSNNPAVPVNWRWNVVASPSSTVGIVDRFTLEPVDTDGDGVIGHQVSTPAAYNVALKLNIESIGSDNSQVKGCFKMKEGASLSLSSNPAFVIPSSMSGTFMSRGDGSYSVIPDPDLAQMYFRNLVGIDVPGTNQIQVTGLFSYNGHPEEPIAWVWNTDSVPSWSDDGTVYNLASDDSDEDGIAGVSIGGDNEMSNVNIALDANLQPVEVRPNESGSYSVNNVEFDGGVVDLTDSGVEITGNTFRSSITYPVTASGDIDGAGALPVVMVMHGNHGTTYGCEEADEGIIQVNSHQGYSYMTDALASHGFIVVSVYQDYNMSNPYRMRLLFEHMEKLSQWNSSAAGVFGSLFVNRLDMSNIGLVGHSRGGGAVELAELTNRTESLGYGINGVVSIAPKTSVNTPPQAPWLILNGSTDGDMGLSGMSRFTQNTVANNYPVSAVWFYGGTHAFFNENWTTKYFSVFGYLENPIRFKDPTAGLPGFWAGYNLQTTPCGEYFFPIAYDERIESARQQQLTNTSINAFFRLHLNSELAFADVMSGELPLYGTHTVEKYWAYASNNRVVVDDFNAQDGVANSSLVGTGAVSSSAGFMSPLSEPTGWFPGRVIGVSNSAYLLAKWNSPQWITWQTSSSGGLDVSSFSHIAFNAAQIADDDFLNFPGQEKDISVVVVDSSGSSFSVSLSDGDQVVPYYSEIVSDIVHDVEKDTFRRTGLTSVRLPLSKFTGVDMSTVQSVTLEFNGTGNIALDDIQFTD